MGLFALQHDVGDVLTQCRPMLVAMSRAAPHQQHVGIGWMPIDKEAQIGSVFVVANARLE